MKSAWITLFVISILIILVSAHSILNSGFFKKSARVNILLYNASPVLYSIGKGDGIDYDTSFNPDLKVPVAGGFGRYRIGAIGKLAQLEKNSDIFQHTFSLLSSSFVTYYFHEPLGAIYFGKAKKVISTPSISTLLFSPSNASVVDRIFLVSLFLRNPISDFRTLTFDSVDDFNKSYLGYFYDRTYRDDKKTVQIIYREDAATASYLGQLLEGEGIRVADISQNSNQSRCEVITNKNSETSQAISSFFNCIQVPGDTGPYDILFKISSLEKNWEIQ